MSVYKNSDNLLEFQFKNLSHDTISIPNLYFRTINKKMDELTYLLNDMFYERIGDSLVITLSKTTPQELNGIVNGKRLVPGKFNDIILLPLCLKKQYLKFRRKDLKNIRFILINYDGLKFFAEVK